MKGNPQIIAELNKLLKNELTEVDSDPFFLCFNRARNQSGFHGRML